MSAPRSFHDAVDRFRHAITPRPVEDDVEMGDYDDQVGDELADRETGPCQQMVTMNVPALGVVGMPQVKCGAPMPRASCPFDHPGCPHRRSVA